MWEFLLQITNRFLKFILLPHPNSYPFKIESNEKYRMAHFASGRPANHGEQLDGDRGLAAVAL